MSRKLVYLVAIFTGAVVNVVTQETAEEKCGQQTSANRYPWLVGIETENTFTSEITIECSGALISRRLVMSTAECTDVHYSITVKAVLLGLFHTIGEGGCSGGGDCMKDGITRITIEEILLHHQYSTDTLDIKNPISEETRLYNIAIITLRDKVQYSDTIRPICLPSADIMQSVAANHNLYMVGHIRENGTVYEAVANYNTRKCQELTEYEGIADDQFCASDVEGPEDLCLATGGLLMNKRGDSYQLLGLMAYNIICPHAKKYTHIFLFLNWIQSKVLEKTDGCGRRRVEHVELIIYGGDTRVGDWPWHVAIYRANGTNNEYKCGGTLISETVVLTAAHCTILESKPVSPELFTVYLGKHYLTDNNSYTQEIKVQTVIIHESFAQRNYLPNDIALLKLRTKAIYNDYVQPACIWYGGAYDRLPTDVLFGSVVGWGVDETGVPSTQLKLANIPMIPDVTCIEKNPSFYANMLKNKKKFCAGWANGTSPCNGDSGGGFHVFVPDAAKDASSNARGTWYVRGIVSTILALNHYQCDPYKYAIFTDVEKYIVWISNYLNF